MKNTYKTHKIETQISYKRYWKSLTFFQKLIEAGKWAISGLWIILLIAFGLMVLFIGLGGIDSIFIN